MSKYRGIYIRTLFSLLFLLVAALLPPTKSNATEAVLERPTFVEISSGANHICGLTSQKQIYCWGQNLWSQLGTSAYKDNLIPHLVYEINDATSISAGTTHTCAIVSNGHIKCWGNNDKGQVGDGRRNLGIRELPVFVHAISDVKSLALGDKHTCALLKDGKIKCWGANDLGQLGNGTNVDSLVPVTVKSDTFFVSLDSGNNHTCAIDSLGDVYCWGNNSVGELGIGNNTSRNLPTLVLGISKVNSISAQFSSSCVVDISNKASCWGEGTNGQLGNYDTTNRLIPSVVVDAAFGGKTAGIYVPAENVINAQVGNTISCVLSTIATAHCWGKSGSFLSAPYYVGQTTTSRDAASVRQIAVGENHYCVLRIDSSIYCSGSNNDGQFGIGSTQTNSLGLSTLVPVNFWPAPISNLSTEVLGNTLNFKWTRDVSDYNPVTKEIMNTTFMISVNKGELSCTAISNFSCAVGPVKSNTKYEVVTTVDNSRNKSSVSAYLETKDILSAQELREKEAKAELETKLKKEEEAKRLVLAEEEAKKKAAEELALNQLAEEKKRVIQELERAALEQAEKMLVKKQSLCFAVAQKFEEIVFISKKSAQTYRFTSFESAFKNVISSLPKIPVCVQNNYTEIDLVVPSKELEIIALAQSQLLREAQKSLSRGKIIYNYKCTKGNVTKKVTSTKVVCPTGYALKN